jgi:hypothetical protein
MNLGTVALSAVLLLATPLFAREKTDVIVMKNGDRITCEIKGLDAGVLYVSIDYVDGTTSVDWSKVAHLESAQLFIVRTQDGSVHKGTLKTVETEAQMPVRIQILESPERKAVVDKPQIVNMAETSEKFRQRFNGAINWGIIYSKGNNSTQYNLGSQVEYLRPRWSVQANLSSSLSSSTGTTASTQNRLNLNGLHLLPWNNYFYAVVGNFLQSSEQGIRLQTSLGGGIGRYLKNTNLATISVMGGVAWQGTDYQTAAVAVSRQNEAAALIAADVKFFRFSKTNLDINALVFPALSEPGRVRFNTTASCYVKLVKNLSWNISFYGNWDNRPPANFSGSDYGSSSGISWTFGLK